MFCDVLENRDPTIAQKQAHEQLQKEKNMRLRTKARENPLRSSQVLPVNDVTE